jgi:hypothetical protein
MEMYYLLDEASALGHSYNPDPSNSPAGGLVCVWICCAAHLKTLATRVIWFVIAVVVIVRILSLVDVAQDGDWSIYAGGV